jgi:hypothetical protein
MDCRPERDAASSLLGARLRAGRDMIGRAAGALENVAARGTTEAQEYDAITNVKLLTFSDNCGPQSLLRPQT